MQWGRFVLEVGTVLGGGEMHLDIVERLALAQVVVIGGGEKPRSVTSHDRLQVPAVYVERQRLQSVHFERPEIEEMRDRNRIMRFD